MVDFYGLPHLSTGNIFRKAIADKTELGLQIEEIMRSGQLVPSETTNAVMRERLEQEDALNGFILDGYPRNENQANELDTMTTLTHVVVIDISDEEAIRRLSQRRSCMNCGETYHLEYKPTKEEGICDACGNETIQRDDDKPEAIAQRLSIYHSETEPVFARYEERGLMHRINGEQSIDEVWSDIQSVLEAA